MNPLTWIEDDNSLNIMSIYGNCIEYIDIRQQRKCAVKEENIDQMFDATFSNHEDDVTCADEASLEIRNLCVFHLYQIVLELSISN